MPLDSRLNNSHDYSWNWVMAARPWGCVMGMHPSMSSFLPIGCHLPWCRILPLIWKGTPVTTGVALFHELIYREPWTTTSGWSQLGMRTCLNKSGGSQKSPSPLSWTEMDRCWSFKYSDVEVLRFLINLLYNFIWNSNSQICASNVLKFLS